MKASKATFEAVAAMIRAKKYRLRPELYAGSISTATAKGGYETCVDLENQFAVAFAASNPRFDRQTFINACNPYI